MPSAPDSAALKRLLAPTLLRVPGVAGIGLPGGRLTVYLESDSADVRHRVEEAVSRVAPQARIRYEVTGRFTKQ